MGRERDRRWRVGERRVRDIDWYLEPEAGGANCEVGIGDDALRAGHSRLSSAEGGRGEVVSGGEAKSKALVGSYNNKISPNRT